MFLSIASSDETYRIVKFILCYSVVNKIFCDTQEDLLVFLASTRNFLFGNQRSTIGLNTGGLLWVKGASNIHCTIKQGGHKSRALEPKHWFLFILAHWFETEILSKVKLFKILSVESLIHIFSFQIIPWKFWLDFVWGMEN